MEVPHPHAEPTPRSVRVRAGGEWIADSRRAMVLSWYGPGMLPTYCFPEEDVRVDLLAPAEGERFDVIPGGIARAARRFAEPPAGIADLVGWWTFDWDVEGLQWFEEAL